MIFEVLQQFCIPDTPNRLQRGGLLFVDRRNMVVEQLPQYAPSEESVSCHGLKRS